MLNAAFLFHLVFSISLPGSARKMCCPLVSSNLYTKSGRVAWGNHIPNQQICFNTFICCVESGCLGLVTTTWDMDRGWYGLCSKPWRIYKSKFLPRYSPSVHFPSVPKSFEGNWPNDRLASPFEVRPPLGNPGSATSNTPIYSGTVKIRHLYLGKEFALVPHISEIPNEAAWLSIKSLISHSLRVEILDK